MNNYLVSIIIPCYNQAHFLDECLESVLNQTYNNWECVIVNDGSPDNTKEIAQKWLDKDNRFKYIEKENGGLSSARNAGLDKSEGNYVQFLDADDCVHPKKIEDSIELFVDKGYDIVITNFNLFESLKILLPPYCDLNQKLFNLKSILYEWDNNFSIPIHCAIFKKNILNFFKFPEHVKAKEDWIMWISLFKLNPKVYFHDEFMAYYRKNPDGMMAGSGNVNMFTELIKSINYLESILSPEEYKSLITAIIKRYYDKSQRFNKELVAIKSNYVYRGLKKFMKIFGKKI
ncbi:glycosyltransferase family 2 protein [Zhouia sp. PK063]|uniref:glycosyltransferase family 2 protein n=1 Tax=Zhouia sp. PK063 TaxID=3373602 RepID=UPI0037A48D4D